MINKKTQGKKNRAAGVRFELRVRKNLQEKGWTVDKWSNNVETEEAVKIYSNEKDFAWWDKNLFPDKKTEIWCKKLIPSKHKFRGPGIPMAIGTGFPDFVAFRCNGYVTEGEELELLGAKNNYEVIAVEAKSNGYLDKTERAKCKWLIENNVFSKILVARKGEKRGEIIYKEFILGG